MLRCFWGVEIQVQKLCICLSATPFYWLGAVPVTWEVVASDLLCSFVIHSYQIICREVEVQRDVLSQPGNGSVLLLECVCGLILEAPCRCLCEKTAGSVLKVPSLIYLSCTSSSWSSLCAGHNTLWPLSLWPFYFDLGDFDEFQRFPLVLLSISQ